MARDGQKARRRGLRRRATAGVRRDEGFVVLLLATLMGFILAAFAAMFVAMASNQSRQTIAQRWVRQAAARVRDWYSTHSLILDASARLSLPGTGSQGDRLLAAAGVQKTTGAQVEIGPLQPVKDGGGNVLWEYRKITIWVAKSYVRPSATFSTAHALAYAFVSGSPIEQRKAQRSWNRMNRLAARLEQWAASHETADPTHNTLLDFFEPPGCGVGNGAQAGLACASRWTNGSGMNFPAATGWGGPWTDAWGGQMQVCNATGSTPACGANDVVPPYTLIIRFTNPWGTTFTVKAVQPMGA